MLFRTVLRISLAAGSILVGVWWEAVRIGAGACWAVSPALVWRFVGLALPPRFATSTVLWRSSLRLEARAVWSARAGESGSSFRSVVGERFCLVLVSTMLVSG